MSEAVTAALEAIRGAHERAEPRLIAERYGAWAFGSMPWEDAQAFGWCVAGAKHQSGSVAAALFDLHAVGHSSQFDKHARIVKDWAYVSAAQFVASQRGPAKFSSYAPSWGRQAARDGLFRALWPEIGTPGRISRAKRFAIGERPYVRVREHVRREAYTLIDAFAFELGYLHRLT